MYDVSTYTTDHDFVFAEWSFVIILSIVIFVVCLIAVVCFIFRRKRNTEIGALNRRLLNQNNINTI